MLAKFIREHKKGLTAVTQVNKYQKQTAARLGQEFDIDENDDNDDEYNDEDIENPIFDDSDDSEVQVLSMLKNCGEVSNPLPDTSSVSSSRQLLMANLGIETVAKAQESVQGQRSRIPTKHFGRYEGAEDRHTYATSNPKLKVPQLTLTKKKRSESDSVAATTSGSAEPVNSAAPVLPSVLPALDDPTLLQNFSNPPVSTGVLPAAIVGTTVDTTGSADIDFTISTYNNNADTALVSNAVAAQGNATQAFEDVPNVIQSQQSSSDDDSVHVPSHCDQDYGSTSDDSDDDASNQLQQSQQSARQRESYHGYDSDLFLDCFNTVPTAFTRGSFASS